MDCEFYFNKAKVLFKSTGGGMSPQKKRDFGGEGNALYLECGGMLH